jgi:EAL domain-containing protein (putative c-di-GMP-specific phosphodiesterase class I)
MYLNSRIDCPRGHVPVSNHSLTGKCVSACQVAVEDIAAGIQAREFVLHYQPRVSLHDRMLIGFEALIRWNNPKLGLLSPATFIPLAEDTGLMVPLSRWVFREACRQMASWQRELPVQLPLTISVNISIPHLADSCLIQDISAALRETALIPGSLRLEMSERSLVAHGEAANPTLRQLKSMQVGLEVDDFGTGSSSLGYLRKLPLDTVKIDRSFVKELGTRNDSSEIIKTILSFVGPLGINIAAEGVETRAQLDRLMSLGCRRGQGYYFSWPVDSERAKALIENERHKRNESRRKIHLV